MLFAILLSVFVFSKQSLRLDESQSLWQTSRNIPGIIHLVGLDVHVPLYHILLHFWELMFGNGVATSRTFSMIFFLLSIPGMYFLGSLAYSRRIGLFSAALLTVSPFMNWYGNEIRMYSLFTFIVIVNQYYFIRIYRRGGKSSWWGYAISALLGIYTHYFFFLNIFTQGLFFLFNKDIFPKDSFKRFLKIGGILALCFLPWVIYKLSLGGLSNTSPLIAPPTSVNVSNTFAQFLFGFQDDHLNTILVSLWPLTVLLGFWALRQNRKVTPETVYFISSVIIPIITAFVISTFFLPVYVSRYLIFTTPSLFLFLSWLLYSYPKFFSTIAKTILLAVMLIALSVQAFSANTPVKEDYRDVAVYLSQHAAPQDVIAVSAPFTIYPIEYYYNGPAGLNTLPVWDRYANGPIPGYSPEELDKDVTTLKGTHQNLYLVLSYDQGYQSDIKSYFDTHFQKLGEQHFSPGLDLYVYKLKY